MSETNWPIKNILKLRCFSAAKVSRQETLPVRRVHPAASGGPVAMVGVFIVGLTGISAGMLADRRSSFESRNMDSDTRRNPVSILYLDAIRFVKWHDVGHEKRVD
jgi:hypothetical protein